MTKDAPRSRRGPKRRSGTKETDAEPPAEAASAPAWETPEPLPSTEAETWLAQPAAPPPAAVEEQVPIEPMPGEDAVQFEPMDALDNPPEAALAVPPSGLTDERLPGLPWLANLGWGAAGFGLLLVAYSYSWAVANWPNNFEPLGVSGAIAGMILTFLGIMLGLVFSFVPTRTTSTVLAEVAPPATDPVGDAQRHWRTNRILSRVGAGVFLFGALLIAWVYRTNVIADEGVDTYSLAGLDLAWNTWAAVAGAIAVGGFALWAFGGIQSSVQRRSLAAYLAAPTHQTAVAAAPPTPGEWAPPSPTPSAEPASVRGVNEEELTALMRKIDAMLASLPDDVVAAFSKSPEADTYLKILSGKK
jgi:hypothetical protein